MHGKPIEGLVALLLNNDDVLKSRSSRKYAQT